MVEKIVVPTGRGALLLDAHPDGCAASVDALVDRVRPAPPPAGGARRPVALVIGSSAGYGLAATLTAIEGRGMDGIGVSLERPASARHTATAGFYRTRRTAQLAAHRGVDFGFLNADCFTDAAKREALDLIAARFGRVDHLVYSVAAPRRTDPRTGVLHQSVIKPLGAPYTTRSLVFGPDGPASAGGLRLGEQTVQAATEDERAATVRVMGGDDWAEWVHAIVARGLAGPRFNTVALSYVGPEMTAPIYRRGTIGAAKDQLEETARRLHEQVLAPRGAAAYTAVLGAAVTQASAAIPGIGLYTAVIRKILGEQLQSSVEQLSRLWDQLTGTAPLDRDEHGRIRLDRWELNPRVQSAAARAWAELAEENLAEHADTEWLRAQVLGLYGFGLDGIDYGAPVETDAAWPEFVVVR
jgi:enoyl-[acyl-carrier protein] reductase / trans-2-enoyl-CoA reductase (NAD+)